jgi:hypothetical protein
MSGIEERIAAVMDDHRYVCHDRCSCGAAVYFKHGPGWERAPSHNMHVASVLMAELGLTEEEGADFTFGGQAADFTFGGQTRYITPWVDDA